MLDKLINELARIRNTVENEDITGLAKETEEWGGADLIVTSDPERAAKVASDYQPIIDIGPTGVSFSNERYTVVLKICPRIELANRKSS